MKKPAAIQGMEKMAAAGDGGAGLPSAHKKARTGKKPPAVALLSFGEEVEEAEQASSGFRSIGQSTSQRFQQEQRSRRRAEEDAAAAARTAPTDTGMPVHQLAAPTPAAASRQCVVDDDHTAWLPLKLRHQVSERQGKRPYMEDMSMYEPDWHHKGWHLFGVFDGHGGSRASCFVRDQIPTILRSRIVDSERETPAGEKEIADALSSSYNEVDRRFLDIARAEQLKDGTTALLGLLRHNTLHMSWVGDTRCILSRQGRYVRVSEDHKPDRPDERKAVEARGGQVIFRGTYRVAGPTALAVSRAIGDILMKEPRKLVVSDPEIKTIDLMPQDEFLVLASDGLYDVMDDQSIIDSVGNHRREHKSCAGAAEKLTSLAIEKGSLDNVTVQIIELLWGASAVDP